MHSPVRSAAVLALLGLAALAHLAHAQDAYPAKPIRLVVGFPAGGPTDVVARAFGDFAARSLGQPVVVDNKPGANTILAAEAVASAPPDGYTLLLGALNHTMIPALYSNRVKFDALRSFAPVCSLAVSPTVLVVGPSMPVRTLPEFLAAVRAKPGERTYATPGSGSGGHFASEQFNRLAGTRMNHIPYKGAAQAVTDLMGGQVDMAFTNIAGAIPMMKNPKLRVIAVSTLKRSSAIPEVPAVSETVAGYDLNAWWGLMAPAGTPKPVVDRLQQEIAKVMRARDMEQRLREMGLEVEASTPEQFAAVVRGDMVKWAAIVKSRNIKLN